MSWSKVWKWKSTRHVQKSELCLVSSFKKNEKFQVAKIVGDESLGSDYQGSLEPTWVYPYFKLISYGLSMHKQNIQEGIFISKDLFCNFVL